MHKDAHKMLAVPNICTHRNVGNCLFLFEKNTKEIQLFWRLAAPLIDQSLGQGFFAVEFAISLQYQRVVPGTLQVACRILINPFKPDFTLSYSSTTSRELLSQFSTCSGSI